MYSGRLWVLVSAVTIDNFPACLGRPGRVWLVIMDGDGEWRQVKVCQRLESRGCVVTSLKLMRRPTLATQQHRHRGDGERDIAPGLHNQVLICSVRRNASFFCTRRLFDLLACVVMLPCVTSALFISPRSPAQTASSHQTASWVSQTQNKLDVKCQESHFEDKSQPMFRMNKVCQAFAWWHQICELSSLKSRLFDSNEYFGGPGPHPIHPSPLRVSD